MSKNPKRAGDNIAEENINSYIQDLLEKGYSEEAIRQQLQRYGYEEEDINNALEDAKEEMQEPRAQAGPVAHSMVMMFLGITLLIGTTMGGLFLFGEERGATGIPTPQEVGVAIQPVQEQRETGQEQLRPQEQRQIPRAPQEITEEPQAPQQETQKCLNGKVTLSWIEQNSDDVITWMFSDDFTDAQVFTKQRDRTRDIVRVVAVNTLNQKYYGSLVPGRPPVVAWENANVLVDDAIVKVTAGVDSQGVIDRAIAEFKDGDYHLDYSPKGNAEQLVRIIDEATKKFRC
ncbi:hypothetical protein J4410_02680 [Candidatus Woesearchaeota archaeon]|nr:hypothetical protein [Candidatus Woesearchaeota archaeon]